jgi:hypothetical protein
MKDLRMCKPGREPISFKDFCRQIEERRKELGMTDQDDWEMRNSGERRTPEKRELLRRIAKRCRAAGIKPYPANY